MRRATACGLVGLAALVGVAGCFSEPEPLGSGSAESGGDTTEDDAGASSEDDSTSGGDSGTSVTTGEAPLEAFSFYEESCEGDWETAVGGAAPVSAPCALDTQEVSAIGGVRIVPMFESAEFGTRDAVVLEPADLPESLLQGAFFLEPDFFAEGPARLLFTYEVVGGDGDLTFQITTPADETTETVFDAGGFLSGEVEVELGGLSGAEISFVVINGPVSAGEAVALYDARIVPGES